MGLSNRRAGGPDCGMSDPQLVGRTAVELASIVRSGTASARAVLDAHATRIAASRDAFGAFDALRLEEARAEAAALDALPPEERAVLPLAGVPVAVKDNVELAGMPMRIGSIATRAEPCAADHEVVARLRRAGALIVGKTRLPELGLWATSDNAFGVARSPWDRSRTAGGSSGGSAAAVASGLVPVAHGNDGLGSIRIPAACCGLVGIKPGPGLVPSGLGADSWHGIAENGVLATTVADAALVLAVMAGDAEPGGTEAPRHPLRIAVAVSTPAPGLPVERQRVAATRDVAAALAAHGHTVEEIRHPRMGPLATAGVIGTWTAGARDELHAHASGDAGVWKRLERRTRGHVRAGAVAERLGLADERHRAHWRATMDVLWERFDLLLTPTLARRPPAAEWRSRGWLANLVGNLLYAPFCGPVNFARLPAVAVPARTHPDGSPASVHFVGPAGSERLLLAVAAEVERIRPWTRYSPRISHALTVMHGTRA